MMFEALKFKNRESILKQQVDTYFMEIKELKQRNVGVAHMPSSDSKLLLSFDVGSSDKQSSTDELARKKSDFGNIASGKLSRPKSTESSKPRHYSVFQSKEDLEKTQMRPSTSEARNRRSSNFNIRKTNLVGRPMQEENDGDENSSEFYKQIEELFVQSPL
jgi:hypothetical protein